jgi:hypothetical protein
MCGGGGSKAPAKAPPQQYTPNPQSVADNSATAKPKSQVVAATNETGAPMSTFGSELATSGGM